MSGVKLMRLGFEGSPGVDDAVDAFFGIGSSGLQGVLDGFKVNSLTFETCYPLKLIHSSIGCCQNWTQGCPFRHCGG